MKRFQVKVCGNNNVENFKEITAIEPDYVGFIFYPKSKRFVEDETIFSIFPNAEKVGVFVNESIEKIVKITEKTNLNFIQLHGDEDEEFIKRLRQMLNENTKIIKVIRIGDDKTNFENKIKK